VIGFGAAGVYVSLSTGGSFDTQTLWIRQYSTNAGGWNTYNTYPRTVTGVNGDGKADVIGFGSAGTYVSLSTGGSFGAQTLWIANYGTNAGGWKTADKYPRIVADANGDRYGEVVAFGDSGVFVSKTNAVP